MTILLNMANVFVVLAWGAAWVAMSRGGCSRRKIKSGWWCIAGAVASIIMMNMLQPSYLPKSAIARSATPEFEHVDIPVTNELRRTDTINNYGAHKKMHDDFIKHNTNRADGN